MSSRSAICVDHLAVLGDDLVLLEAGEALQLHLEDALRLRVGQAVAVVGVQAEVRGQPLGRELRRRRRARASPRPAASATLRAISSLLAPRRASARALISAMISSTFDSATARPSRMWPRSRALRRSNTRAARHHLAAVAQERVEHLLQVRAGAAGRRPAPPCSCRRCPAAACACTGCSGRPRATSPRFSSITTRMPDLSDSSRMSEMPSMLLLAHQLGDAARAGRALFTW